MEKYRIGSDIDIYWVVRDSNSDLATLDNYRIRLFYKCFGGRVEVTDFTHDDNTISWKFRAEDQKYLGDYTLTVELYTPLAEFVVRKDYCMAFSLVGCSCEETPATMSIEGVTETLNLTSEFNVVRAIPVVPVIGENGNWWIDGVDTGKVAEAHAAVIDENGYWKVDNVGTGITAASMREVTYSQLKALRDERNLEPGLQYRIVDYQTTTMQEGTKGSGHQFDIIVTANDNSTLNEKARACLHEGDTYFSNANLGAWQIWYCLDNDTTRYDWADVQGGRGVIYRMIDEWGNDCPYDFKNIQFKRYILRAEDAFETSHPVDGLLSSVRASLISESIKIASTFWYYGEYINDIYPEAELEAKYVPYGDVGFLNNGPGVLCKIDEENFKWYYTFHNPLNDSDSSTIKHQYFTVIQVRNNVMKQVRSGMHASGNVGTHEKDYAGIRLNNIILLGARLQGNTFGIDCHDITLQQNEGITFGDECSLICLGNNSKAIKFDYGCKQIRIGSMCEYITFEKHVQYVSFLGSQQVTRVHVKTGVKNGLIKPKINTNYLTTVAVNTQGEIKMYCEADLIA